MASYMKECLLHPTAVSIEPLLLILAVLQGYYMKKKNVFGSRGDFTTSPEISQVFGEVEHTPHTHTHTQQQWHTVGGCVGVG